MWFTLRYLCLATAVLCMERPRLQDVEELKNRYHFRRAVDGSRGSKYFDPDENGSYDHYRHLEDHYDGSKVESGFADIRVNVPGEPGADYPVFTAVPKTGFSCENRAQGYYADEEAGCQAFHVCSNVVVSSFICPVGSIFSQKLLTCDWWNNVDCATTESYYTMRQESFKDTKEMVQKAVAMMQPPKPNVIQSDPQIEESPPRTVNIGFRGTDREKFDVRGAFGTSGDENVRKYNHFYTKETGIFENSGFGGDRAGAVNENTQPMQNVINVNLRPKDYVGNFEGFGSRLENRAKDSPIVFVQKYPNDNVQESSTLRPFALGNILRGSYQFNVNSFRNSYQPSSYAPTVPTVTTTTRRLYSPTVPTTHRPSTISYDEYDQDSEGYLLQLKPHQQSGQVYETAPYNGQYQGNFAETIQPEESIGIVQSYGERLIKSDARSEFNRRDTGARFRARSETVNSNAPEHKEGYRHFYTDQLTVDSRLRQQDTEAVGGVPVDSSEESKRSEKQKNSEFANLQRDVPPLIVQIPRPEGEPGKPATDIGDQLFTYDSFMKTSSVMPETSPPIESSPPNSAGVSTRINSADSSTIIAPLIPETAPPPVSSSSGATGDEDVFPPPRRRPPMISDIPQSIGTLGLNFSGVLETAPPVSPSSASSVGTINDENVFPPPRRRPPMISDIPQSIGTSGLNLPGVPDQTQTSDSSRTTTSTPETTQRPASSGETTFSLMDDNATTVPPRTTPIISQIPGSVGASGVNISDTTDRNFTLESPLMPLPIFQPTVNATPPAPQPSSMVDDSSAFDTPPRIIPPLIPEVAQPSPTENPISTDIPDSIQTLESSSRIPPLIPPTPRPVPPSFSGTIDNGDIPTRIPPLIPPGPQSTDTPVTSLPNGNDGTNTFESSSRIPPLIPPTPRPPPPPRPQFSGTNGDDDIPSRIPPLIPPGPQSTVTPAMGPPDGNDGTNTLESSSRIPPLIPPTPRPLPPSFSGTIDNGDIPTRIPPLIPPGPQSTDTPVTSLPNGNDGTNTFESSSRIPLLIPPTPRPPPPPRPQFSGTNDDDDIPSRIPPLIPPVPQSTDTPVTSLPNGNDGTNTFESSSRIPPLISPAPRPPPPPRPQFSGTNDDDDIPLRIPPLIPQVPEPTDTPTTDVPDNPDVTYPYELPSNIPPLISQTPRPPAPSDSSSGTTDSGKVPTRIPLLIPQTPKPIDTLAINSPDERYPFELPSNIPPLLPPTPRTPPPSQTQSSDMIDDDDVPAKIPPLIPQIPQPTDTPATDAPDISDTTYPFELPSGIPPLIPQTSRPSPPSESQSPDTIDDGNTPIRIPPLIPETPSSGVNDGKKTVDSPSMVPPLIHQTPDTSDISDSSYPFEVPSSIPPLIPQPMVNDEDTSIVPPGIQPVNPLISESAGTPGANQLDVPVRNHPSEVPSGTPPSIPQDSRFGTPSGTKSPNQIVGKDESHVPTTVAPVIPQILEYLGRPGVNPSNIFYHTKSSYESNRPSPDLLPPSYLGSVDTNSNNRNPSNWVSSTTEQTFFTYTGQYQPLPINIFPTSTTQQPDYSYSLVTSPTVNIPAYHSKVPETATISPTPHVENPGSSGYGMDVPDSGPSGTSHSTPETIPSTSSDDQSSEVGSSESEVEQTRVQIPGGISQFPTDDSEQSSVTQDYDIAMGFLPPKIDSQYPNAIRHNVTRQNLTNEETSMLASLGADLNHDKYNSFEQPSISPSTDSEKSRPQVSGPEENDDLRFTIRGGLRHPILTPLPAFSGISSTLRPRTESLSPPRQSVSISDNPNTQFVQPQLYYPENVALNGHQESSTQSTYKDRNLTPQPTESSSGEISYSQGPYSAQYPPSAIESGLSPDTSRDAYLQSIGSGGLPPGFPTGFSQIQASLNNDDSPYQITITLNGGEDFNPTPDFISRLLAQHNADGQLGFDHLAGYEIVRSEDPDDPPVEDVTPTASVNIAPSQAPTLATLFDSRFSSGGQQSAQQYYVSGQNADTGISLTTSETRGPEVKPLTPDVPRPSSFFGDGPNAVSQNSLNLESFDLPIKNATQWTSELRDEEIRNRANLLKLRAEDINSSFESLAKSVVPKKTENSPLVKEQILEQLTRNFGQPLFNYGGSQGHSVRSETPRSIDYTDKQQFVDLKKYRVQNKDVVKESEESTSPASPETSTIVTTTTSTTPEPIRTFVETEFLPSLSFSFDSDTGRQEYVDAVLKGLLNDNHPVDPWYDFAAFNRESRENEKSKNETTEVQKA